MILSLARCALVRPYGLEGGARVAMVSCLRLKGLMVYELPSRKVSARTRVRGDHSDVGRKVVTWLILPVVICLSQRLSHACLSINKFVL